MGQRKQRPAVNEDEVEQIRLAYPKKNDKLAAQRAIRRCLKIHTFVVIMEGVQEFAMAIEKQHTRRDPELWQKVRFPATYFNGQGYLDDVDTWPWFQSHGKARMPAKDGKYDRYK